VVKNNRRGLVLVISSPSGAGKTTICKNIIEKVDNVSLSVSVTTRKKRKGEIEGKDYFFKTNEEFIPMMSNNEFIESAKVFGNFYGTLKAEVLQKIEDGIDVLVDIDWQGTRQIEKHMPEDIVKIFILPPSIKELEYRLGNRASENKEDFNKRMSEARKEISHYNEYDFVIINEEIDIAVNLVKSILYSERLRKHRQTSLQNVVNNLL
jgi:guanylate kinase|tara:strand:- start:526 stop:1149 length:624 start_codon:yes stop_codon:yes gene_type:complete